MFSGAGASDNIDSMSVNGSIVSNGSMTSVAGAGQTNGVNGHGHSNGHSNVHTNGMATLPHVRPTTGGDTVSRNSTLDSPKHDSASTQNGTGSGSTSSLMKPKTPPRGGGGGEAVTDLSAQIRLAAVKGERSQKKIGP